MLQNFEHVRIHSSVGISGKKSLDVEAFALQHNLNIKKVHRFIKHMGFKSIRVVEKPLTVSDMCVTGGQYLLQSAGMDPSEIDALIVVTQSPDFLVPATSYGMQERLSLRNDVLMMDLTQGCSGWVYGLFYASTLIESKICRNVLLCTGDLTFHEDIPISSDDNISRLTLGDGACVTLLSYSEEKVLSSFSIRTNGEKHSVIKNDSSGCRFYRYSKNNDCPSGMETDGVAFAEYALEVVPEELHKLLSKNNLQLSDLSYFLVHQSNKNLLQSLALVLGMPVEFVPFLAGNTGNTSSATIPLALSENLSNLPDVFKSRKTALCGVGVGLSCVTALVDLTSTKIFPAIYM